MHGKNLFCIFLKKNYANSILCPKFHQLKFEKYRRAQKQRILFNFDQFCFEFIFQNSLCLFFNLSILIIIISKTPLIETCKR
jgi:hypothetical protein